jgi:hypothetical protein
MACIVFRQLGFLGRFPRITFRLSSGASAKVVEASTDSMWGEADRSVRPTRLRFAFSSKMVCNCFFQCDLANLFFCSVFLL